MDAPIKSLKLPDRKEHEIVLLKRPDGTVIARTVAELKQQPRKEGA